MTTMAAKWGCLRGSSHVRDSVHCGLPGTAGGLRCFSHPDMRQLEAIPTGELFLLGLTGAVAHTTQTSGSSLVKVASTRGTIAGCVVCSCVGVAAAASALLCRTGWQRMRVGVCLEP